MQSAENIGNATNPTIPPPPPEDEINLLDLIEVLARRWKFIIGTTFLVAVLTAIFTLFMPNIYTAKTMIIPSDSDSGGLGAALMAQLGGLAGLAGGSLGGKTTGDLYLTMLKSDTLKDTIIDTYKLKERYEAKYRSDLYKRLDEMVNVSLGKKDGVITVSVDEKDPNLAAEIANSYVAELGKLSAKLNMTGAANNRTFLEKRLSEAKGDLTKAEESLKIFQSKNKAISVTEQAKATLEGVAQLRAQLAIKEVELGALRSQLTDASQEIITIKSAISSIKSQIAALEGNSGKSASSIPALGSVPSLGQEYVRLMRDFKVQEAIFEMLTKQYEVTKLNETKDVAPFQLLQKAKTPERKSKPKRAQIVIMSAFSTGFLMVLISFLQNMKNNMVSEDRKRWEQIRQMLSPFRRIHN